MFVLAPLPELIELADHLLARDGCLNFFAGPTAPDLAARINFYKVHYAGSHVVGTSGGNIADSLEALDLMARGKINPAIMITHIGGLTAARDTTMRLPQLAGGKKLIYTHLDLPLTAIEDFAELGEAFAAEPGGLEHRASVGIGEARLMACRDIVNFGVTWLEANR